MQVYIIYRQLPNSDLLGLVGAVAAYDEADAIKWAAKRWGPDNYQARLSA